MARLWRSSLHFRVVVVTMGLSLAVMVFLQSFIYQRIADGLLEARTSVALQDAAYSYRDMQAQLDHTDKTDAEDVRQFAYDLLRKESRDGDQSRQLILTRAANNPAGPAPTLFTGVDVSVVPDDLRAALQQDPQHQHSQVVTLDRPGLTGPALVVGSRITVQVLGDHELYYVFPLTREQQTLDTVRNTFILGVTVFVLLIGLVVYVVARLAVDPVREAAVVAARISSGRLNERMHVRGEDDLATLATSFNGMADHLQEQIRQLEDLSRVQQRFVSDVSHELRTPLTTIRMAAEMIYDGKDGFSPVVARSAELLIAQLDRFEALLADLLEISRFDAGAAVLDREDADVSRIVERVVHGVDALARSTGTEIVVIGADGPLRCEMDSRRVERILRNLVVNAIEYGAGAPVHIELGGSETAVAVAVRDHGVGLQPGEADLVFHRFWRADPARTRTTGGTGLGLAISLEDARLHDGWLHAWGQPGSGSRFRLTLPRVPGRPIGYPPLPLMDAGGEAGTGPTETSP
ncbi:MAG TPA: MtrAB system histidine kinase MtrB [Dermatophilaceae bacterium]|nr:MtrAB system histidine kinase MtrB [Dermatophilaceae bacterium]